jgi:hypothetical protein
MVLQPRMSAGYYASRSQRPEGSELIWQHDKDKDGFLTKDEVIQLSESLLVRGLQLAHRFERF